MTEIWKEVVEYEGLYEVSSQGRVRCLKPIRNRRPQGLLKQSKNYWGYLVFGLRDPITRASKVVRGHMIVAQAFLGPCPSGHQVNHKNGIRVDNRIENLEYSTPSENNLHAHRTLPRGRLTRDLAREIRDRSEEDFDDLALEFRVSKKTIRDVIEGRTWKKAGGLPLPARKA